VQDQTSAEPPALSPIVVMESSMLSTVKFAIMESLDPIPTTTSKSMVAQPPAPTMPAEAAMVVLGPSHWPLSLATSPPQLPNILVPLLLPLALRK